MNSLYVPITPIPQPRHRCPLKGSTPYLPDGHAIFAYKKAIRMAWQQPQLVGPLAMEIKFCFARPKAHYKVLNGIATNTLKANAPKYRDKTPDVDNLAKAVLDALNKVAYCDDAQVVRLVIAKDYASRKKPEGIYVKLSELDG